MKRERLDGRFKFNYFYLLQISFAVVSLSMTSCMKGNADNIKPDLTVLETSSFNKRPLDGVFIRTEQFYKADYPSTFVRKTALTTIQLQYLENALQIASNGDFSITDKQITSIEKVLEFGPVANLYFYLGNVYYFRKDYHSAGICFLLSAFSGYSESYFSFYNSACCYSILGMQDFSLKCFEMALRLNYDDFELFRKDVDLLFLRSKVDIEAYIKNIDFYVTQLLEVSTLTLPYDFRLAEEKTGEKWHYESDFRFPNLSIGFDIIGDNWSLSEKIDGSCLMVNGTLQYEIKRWMFASGSYPAGGGAGMMDDSETELGTIYFNISPIRIVSIKSQDFKDNYTASVFCFKILDSHSNSVHNNDLVLPFGLKVPFTQYYFKLPIDAFMRFL